MTDAVRPTKRQREILTYIEAFIAEHGYSPSYREIMNGLQYTSVATVALHVNSLINRGHLRKRTHAARSLEVVRTSASFAADSAVRVKPAQEKWLVDQVEQRMRDAEQSMTTAPGMIDELYVLVGALKVLGLVDAARSFVPRLQALQQSQRQ